MSRLAGCFQGLREQKKTALIPFVTAGDPDVDLTVPLMHKMVEAGADILELGVPFSDPMADGPVIQRANERALVNQVSLHTVLEMVVKFRQQDQQTPVVLMGYMNPFEVLGYQDFAEQAGTAGVDGVIAVDLPPEEAADFITAMKSQHIDTIFLIAPTSNEQRIDLIAEHASGFLYYVSLKGVTGAANINVDEVSAKISQIRARTSLPIGVGFGIKDAATAARFKTLADAVVVGSAVVKKLEEFAGDADRTISEVSGLLTGIREALDS